MNRKKKASKLDAMVRKLRQHAAKGVVLLLLGALSACGEGAEAIPPQQWQGVTVQVESRPSPPIPGMNEFLVMVTGKHDRPVWDLVVSLRTDDHDGWAQAIQDGQMGIYRKAVDVQPGSRAVLQVQIKKRDGAESVLRFPLKVAQGG